MVLASNSRSGCAIGTADTSVDKEAMEVCVSHVVDACQPGVELFSDLNPSAEEVQLKQTQANL